MLLRRIPLPQKNNQNFEAIITANDKFLQDEVEEIWDKLQSNREERVAYEFGPFILEIRPRQRAA